MRVRGGLLPWLLVLASVLACSTPVGVRRVAPRDVHRALTANVLSTGNPSAASTQVLHQMDLFDLYQSDPNAVIRALRASTLEKSIRPDLLFVLAELEFHQGEQARRSDARTHFLAAAFYAHRYMVSLPGGDNLLGVDPRFRISIDLYNRGLTSGLASDDGERVDLSPRTLPLPFGELVLERDEDDLMWGGYRMKDFAPVAELEVRGLRNRYRRPGMGAPLAASIEPVELENPPPGFGHISRGVRVPATALVLFSPGAPVAEGAVVHARLRVYTLDDATSVSIGDLQVALEYEPTAALAFGLAESRLWEFERAGFLSGDFGQDRDRGLRMLSPYDRKRVPVVFVHGTASSPARWAEMINHLQSDSTILEAYQFWIFQYNTGNPIPFSAGLLRQSLIDLVLELDPEGDDDNLQEMVVIGHSQGGLLAKLCVVESGEVFWRNISTASIDSLDLMPETRETLERSLFFEPLPFVNRVIFVATPHRGSFIADRWYSRIAARFMTVTNEIADAAADLFGQDDDGVLIRGLEDMPSSLDNMSLDNPFIRSLSELPIAPGVEAHSIIAVQVGQDFEPGHESENALWHDGVVSLDSARLEGVESELIVRSGHSTQSHPTTIGEVLRILRSSH